MEKLKKLDLNEIYTQSSLNINEIKIAKLEIQRVPTEAAIIQKIESIKAVGLLTPLTLVSARQCLDEGLVITLNDKRVTFETPALDSIYALIDGGHRHCACKRINSERGIGESNIEIKYQVSDSPSCSISEIIKEANISSVCWSKNNYLSSLIAKKRAEGIESEKLKWIWNKIDTKVCSEAAAWTWATMSLNQVPPKHKITKADRDPKIYKEISDEELFSEGKKLFNAANKCLGSKLMQLKVIPEFFSRTIKTEKSLEAKVVADSLLKFTEQLTDANVSELTKAKGKRADKDKFIDSKLSELYLSFVESQDEIN